jgi:hypothetical protein
VRFNVTGEPAQNAGANTGNEPCLRCPAVFAENGNTGNQMAKLAIVWLL